MTKYARKLLVLILLGGFLVSCSNAGDGNATPSGNLVETSPAGGNDQGITVTVDPLGTQVSDAISAPVMASALLGFEAANQDGRFGSVEGFLLDAFSGRIHSLLIKTIGPEPERTLLLPWGTFSIIAGRARQNPGTPAPAPQVWLEGSNDDLDGAPEVNLENLEHPDQLHQGWDTDLQAYWTSWIPEQTTTGATPTTETTQPVEQPGVYLFVQERSQYALQLDVNTPTGTRLGMVKDLIIGQDGVATFAVLVPEPALKLEHDRVPVAWKVLAWSPETKSFILHAPEDLLVQAPGIEDESVPDMTLPGWDAPWRDFWENRSGGAATGAGSTPTLLEDQSPIRASTAIGLPVIDRQGVEVGKIMDWSINSQGRSNFALVVSESDGRILPMPWLAVDRSQAGRLVTIVDRSVLDHAPTYVSAAYLDANPVWHEEAFAYWQSYLQLPTNPGSRTEEENSLFLRVIQLLGGGVADASKAGLGSLDDVILNSDGTIAYLVVHSGSILRPVPWMDFAYDFQTRTLRYIDDPLRLESAPGFARLEEIDVNTPGWDDQIRSHWGMK